MNGTRLDVVDGDRNDLAQCRYVQKPNRTAGEFNKLKSTRVGVGRSRDTKQYAGKEKDGRSKEPQESYGRAITALVRNSSRPQG